MRKVNNDKQNLVWKITDDSPNLQFSRYTVPDDIINLSLKSLK